jgi:hypothetical protein
MILGLKLREESTVIDLTKLLTREQVPWPVWVMKLRGKKTPNERSVVIIAQEILGYLERF